MAMDLAERVITGVALSAIIAAIAWRRGSLAPSGAAAAVGVGTPIYVAGGMAWFGVLLGFFVTSSLLAKVGAEAKADAKRQFSKGDTRDARQVLCNGGLAALAAALWAWQPNPVFAGAFLGGLATANGDTWATELGVLSRAEPLSITSFKRVPRGTSGAISPLGTWATAGGAALVGGIAALGASHFQSAPAALALASLVGGMVGAFTDSLFGATLQSRYRCDRCAADTEGSLHHCGETTRLQGGVAWFDNDGVNLSATAAGAITGAALLWGIGAF